MHASPIKLLALSASTASAAVHVVKVGENGLNFTPAQTSAKVGDTVEFHFYEGFHSVAQSSFAKPCEPINSTAFFSGDQNVKTKVSDKVFTIEVKSEDPIWYYCAVQGHCNGGGMVGAINAPTSGAKSFDNYAKAAADSKDSSAPKSTGGGKLGAAETGSASGSASGTATATATESGTAASASATQSGNAGIEARGQIQWGLMSGAIAALFGGLMM
ncbi:hypothetical protein FOQG_05573 [Fusarium oxysporum f. sp. raphani 54005]|uniref:Phytocyanin domain-containing protein n=2 Tax=Fusarium oxysporum f. sp. raphani TaxID=96318 RepID=X0CNK2_FUSOX|nr:hypothetical protein FOQG_05573 [Fusarium oxysporum f. sp. raphani 54005]KAG7431578.1 putative GPI-anchored cupredoxin [Fusarium oxysporum f. sp. raphani]KAJ4053839.1 hypothetical protein NW758_003632 [Fusarium oxysporum]KAJ4096438.1 hypothetical protein NW761_004398 [Fusarium oxysporum]